MQIQPRFVSFRGAVVLKMPIISMQIFNAFEFFNFNDIDLAE